jgi:hypothetical protein
MGTLKHPHTALTATVTRFSAGAYGRAAPLIAVAMLTPVFGSPTVLAAQVLALYGVRW